jgi:UPF0755 protein
VFSATAAHEPVVYGDRYGGNYGARALDATAASPTIFGEATAAAPAFAANDPYGDSAYTDVDYTNADYVDDGDGGGRAGLDEDLDDGDADERPRRGWTRLLMVVGIIVALLVGVLAAVGFWGSRQVNPSGAPGEHVTIELTSGMSTPDIAQVLADNGVVSDARIFTFYARFRSKGDIQAGTYESLQTNMAMGDVLSLLAEGPDWEEGQANITAGQTVDEMLTLLGENISAFEEDELRAALADVEMPHLPEGEDNPEGLLAPGDYEFDDTTEAEFVQLMASRFDQVYEELQVDERVAELDIGDDIELTGYDIVIVASMIERETAHDDEKPMIARVIYNRLVADRALGIDATSCYDKGNPCFPLSSEDLSGPYSTRHEPGLPPTPIASPSEASLEAALEPAEGDWDHYVLDVEEGDGRHFFTDDQEAWAEKREVCADAGQCG